MFTANGDSRRAVFFMKKALPFIVIAFLSLLTSLNPSIVKAANTIIDDDHSAYSTSWTDFATQGYQNNGVHYPSSPAAGQTATWTFDTISPGDYFVYVSWSTHANRTTTAPFKLTYDGGTLDKIVNQKKLSDQTTDGTSGQWSGWYLLTNIKVKLNTSSNLTLTTVDNTGGNDYVIADEVLLVPALAPNQVWVDKLFDQNGENNGHVWNYDAFNIIQSGVNAAVSSGTVNVASGTYSENQILITKPVSVSGAGKATTTIDGVSALTLVNPGLVRITAGGNVTFQGFTIKNAGVDPAITGNSGMPVRVGIYASSVDSGSTYTINNSKIIGTNNPNDEEDYGFYSNSGQESLVFTFNEISQTGSNAILLEKHSGATNVSNNTWDRGVADGTVDPYFNMNYDGADITTLQKVSHNTIDMGTGAVFDNDHRGFAITFASSFTGTPGRFTNIQVTDNLILNLKDYRRGIGFWNNAPSDGATGNIQAPLISGNTMLGVPGNTGSQGIRLLGLVTNAIIGNNTINNVDIVFRGQLWNGHVSTGTLLNNNSFNNFNSLQWDGSNPLDATKNWWGTAVKSKIQAKNIGNVNFEPYYVNSTKTLLSSTVPATTYISPSFTDNYAYGHILGYDAFNKIQDGIDAVSQSGTVNVWGGTYSENININKPLSVLGANKITTTIDGLADQNSVVTISSKDVTFKKFTVKNEKRIDLTGNSFLLYANNIDSTSDNANVLITDNIFGPQSAPGGAEGGRHGMYLDGVTRQLKGVVISNNEIKEIKGNGNGIMLWARKEPGGIYADSLLENISIQNNNIHDTRRSGIEAAGEFKNSTISNNYIHNNGFTAEPGTPGAKYGNGIVLFKDHAETDSSVRDHITITGNAISNNTHSGIYLSGSSINNSILSNNIENNKWGLVLDKDPNSSYSPDPNPAKPIDDTTLGNLVNNNTISANSEIGVYNSFSAIINATQNWWGAKNGPSGGVSDPQTGKIAGGNGDKISSNVRFDPWSQTPVGFYNKKYGNGTNTLWVNTSTGKFIFSFSGFASQSFCSGTKAVPKIRGSVYMTSDKCSEDARDRINISGNVYGTVKITVTDRGSSWREMAFRNYTLNPL